jgi:hypothetical protein
MDVICRHRRSRRDFVPIVSFHSNPSLCRHAPLDPVDILVIIHLVVTGTAVCSLYQLSLTLAHSRLCTYLMFTLSFDVVAEHSLAPFVIRSAFGRWKCFRMTDVRLPLVVCFIFFMTVCLFVS